LSGSGETLKFLNSHSIKDAMVMAAGLGTRLRPFSDFQTKALLPVMGVPIIQYTIDSLVHAGVEKIVANFHHQGRRSAEGIAALEYGTSSLILSDESQMLLGSAGGIKKALSSFGSEPFFLANADVLCDVNWNELAKRHQYLRSTEGVVLTLTLFTAGPVGAKYREIKFDASTGLVTSLGELAEGRPYFVGAAVVEPEALAGVPDGVTSDFVQSILRPAMSAGRAGVFVSQGPWLDIGEPRLWLKSHLDLMEMIENGQTQGRTSLLWQDRILKKNRKVSPGVWTSRDSVVPDYSHWKGPCYWDSQFCSGSFNDASLYDASNDQGASAPRFLGPSAVLYGPGAGDKAYLHGIGFKGEWAEVK
jgi:MurNAc alpha-1-phosphate uridylyltransferase